MAEEERSDRKIQKQIERAAKRFAQVSGENNRIPLDLAMHENNPKMGSNPNGKVAFSLSKLGLGSEITEKRKLGTGFEDGTKEGENGSSNTRVSKESNEHKTCGGDTRVKKEDNKCCDGAALAELMKEQEREKEKMNRKDYCLCEGIVVKVMNKGLADKGYYKQKGVIIKVIGKYLGEIKMIESGHVLRVDKEELETVIPQIGGLVRVVNGAYTGCNGRLLGIDKDKFCAKVQIEKGIYDGRVLPAIEYEDICKFTQ